MDEATKRKLDEQTKDLYAALGRFAVEFEQVCHQMRLIVTTILQNQGLKDANVQQILLSGKTAGAARKIWPVARVAYLAISSVPFPRFPID